MTSKIKTAALLFIAITFTASVNAMDSKTSTFKTSQEAAEKGKNDLLSLLKMKHGFNLSVKASEIEESRLGKPITAYDIDFQKLLSAQQKTPIIELSTSASKNMTPLQNSNGVIGVIDTRKKENGWQVSGLTNDTIKNDLNLIAKTGWLKDQPRIEYFEIPNLYSRVYAIKTERRTGYFSNHEGFSMRKPVSIEDLLPKLQQDARQFEKIYGQTLKEKHLVR